MINWSPPSRGVIYYEGFSVVKFFRLLRARSRPCRFARPPPLWRIGNEGRRVADVLPERGFDHFRGPRNMFASWAEWPEPPRRSHDRDVDDAGSSPVALKSIVRNFFNARMKIRWRELVSGAAPCFMACSGVWAVPSNAVEVGSGVSWASFRCLVIFPSTRNAIISGRSSFCSDRSFFLFASTTRQPFPR